ncbi:MAG: hypothetical protein NTX45_25310 [Proteobacteria bacterium]|nr:hypothetical protein [Pseudomonadota bacterium]
MFTNKNVKLGFVALMLTLASSTSLAAPQWCYGKVSNLWMAANGELYVFTSWRNDYVRVCNINQNLGPVTPQNCASWLTLLRNAVTNKENTIIYYDNAPACKDIPVYANAPVPGYVMLQD